eukprot:Pgem_evm1s3175
MLYFELAVVIWALMYVCMDGRSNKAGTFFVNKADEVEIYNVYVIVSIVIKLIPMFVIKKYPTFTIPTLVN